MIWLAYRQFRTQAAAGFAAVAAVTVVLVATGPRLHDLAGIDGSVFDRLTRTDRNLYYAGIVVVAIAPALIGAFWGAPLIARELEAGTHRLAWNQSVTRTRWMAVKLGFTSLATAATAGVLTLAVTWWSAPIDGARSSTHGNLPARLTPVSFAMRGVAPAGYAVFALVLGVAVGLVVRRTLPAIALTLLIYTAVQIAVPLWVRPHLIAPVTETVTMTRANLDGIMADGNGKPVRVMANTGDPGNWVLSDQTIDRGGHVAAIPAWTADCFGPPAPSATRQAVKADIDACFARFTAEGYRQRLVYQPANRFWPLQWAETGMFLVAAGVLSVGCFWWVRRRII